MKKTVSVLILILALSLLSACGRTAAPVSSADDANTFQTVRHAEITVKDYGTIKLELDEGTAPITVANFIKLAQSGFYDGLTFHRIMDGFMIQGGDPLGNGRGSADETIKGEFSSNGVDNPISHKAGVISMARSKNPDSASCQFFMAVGLDIVQQIAKDAHPMDNNGTIRTDQQPVIESIVITD